MNVLDSSDRREASIVIAVNDASIKYIFRQTFRTARCRINVVLGSIDKPFIHIWLFILYLILWLTSRITIARKLSI